MKKKVLLVYPSFSFEGSLVEDAESTMPSIPLLYIAGNLVSEHEVRYLDMNLSKKPIEDELQAFNPDFVALTSYAVNFPEAVRVAKSIKSNNLNTKIILGGHHALQCGRQIVEQYPEFDFVLRGEGEFSFRDLVNGKSPLEIPGLLFKANNQVIDNGSAMVPNLDSIQFPAREIVDPKDYSESPIYYLNEPHTFLLSSRGCIHECTFCDYANKDPLRGRSAENVLAELRVMQRQGYKDFRIIDELFSYSKPRVKQICEGMAKEKMDFSWHCQTRADLLDDEMLDKMAGAGCFSIQMGVETGSQRVMDKIKKRLTLETVQKGVDMVKSHGMKAYGSFMLGFPFETDEERYQTIEFAKSLNLDMAFFSIVTPLPGTELWKESGLDAMNNDDLKKLRIFTPEGSFVEKEKIQKVHRDAVKGFYLRPKTALKILADATLNGATRRRTRYLKFLWSQMRSPTYF
ncbi:MAG: radical SAM protein [Candidatus Diapherotrites archaeon]|nr:radical SAM protein [Candidatus Diapherotrites archaeon]